MIHQPLRLRFPSNTLESFDDNAESGTASLDIAFERIRSRTWVEHHQSLELQIVERDAHGRAERRRVLPLHFYSDALAVLEQQEV